MVCVLLLALFGCAGGREGTGGSLVGAEQWPLFKIPVVNLAAFTELSSLFGIHHKKGGTAILASLPSVL